MKKIFSIFCLVAMLMGLTSKAAATPVEVINNNNVLATLTEGATGVYSGFMFANANQEITFREADGTLWGNSTTAGSFKLVNSGTFWDCWFPAQTGDWLVQFDKNKSEWSASLLNCVYVNNQPMRYDASQKVWKGAVTTTAANTDLQFIAVAGRYDYTTSTGYCEDTFVSA